MGYSVKRRIWFSLIMLILFLNLFIVSYLYNIRGNPIIEIGIGSFWVNSLMMLLSVIAMLKSFFIILQSGTTR